MSIAAYSDQSDQRTVQEIYTRAMTLKRARDQASHGRWARQGATQIQMHERYGNLISVEDAPTAPQEMETLARAIAEINAAHLKLQARVLRVLEPRRP
jgi:hypothetical protein